MQDALKIYEVGPRDGLQNESSQVETAPKLALVDALVAAGLQHIELTSFVHPQAVPQLADADEVMRTAVARHPQTDFIGLAFNQRGYDRALASGCRAIACGVSASETFSQNNTRMSTQRALEISRDLARQAKRDGLWCRVYLMTAWICPFEGPTPPQRALALAQEIWGMGIDEIAIADTIGHAHPLEVGALLEQLGRRIEPQHIAVHFHDTQALALANATVALQNEIRIFDSSIGGLGGCPFAPGAAGNLATEDLVFLAYKMGLGTGVDFPALWNIVDLVGRLIGRPVGGRIRGWWQSQYPEDAPDVKFR